MILMNLFIVISNLTNTFAVCERVLFDEVQWI